MSKDSLKAYFENVNIAKCSDLNGILEHRE